MEVKTESSKNPGAKEFEALLKEDLKKRDLKEGNIIKATISEIGKKYVFVDLKAKSEGIIPIEEFKISKEFQDLKVGSKIDVYLERIESFKTGEIVVSREKARRMSTWKKMEKAFETQEEVEGIITNKVKGGLVVNVNSCLCFLPGSQISTTPLKNFEIDKLMNKPLKFIVVKCDKARGNLVVSRRAILEKSRNEGLEKILSKIKVGDIVEGKCKAILDWGAFIDLDGADGLCHVTDLAYSRVKKTSDLLSVGQTMKFKVIKIDPETKRISLGIKQMFADPYEDLDKKYKVGDICKAVVTKCVEYGVFAKISENLEGLIHSSELSYTKKNVQPSKILSPSQEIKVRIIEIDTSKRRISLSYRQTLENPWDIVTKKSPVGSTVNCKVNNITDFGLFVSIENSDLIGMIHFKDLAWNENDQNLKKFKKNDSLKAKILEIDKEKEKIRLGLKQLEKSPFDYFKDENLKIGSIITVSVKEILPKKGIRVVIGNNENLITTIKKSDLALNVQDQRETIFQPGNRLDCAIIDLKPEQSKIVLSVKEKERIENQEAIKKFGKEGKSSGQSLKSIFNKVLGSKKKSKKKDKEDK